MKYRTLGNTDLELSTVSLGCWAFMGGDLWGNQEQHELDNIVAAALDLGINLFDTAEGYGDGCSEQRLGQALASRRNSALIATKVSGQHLAPGDLRKACERSLTNLGTDTIDLYQLHWPNHSIPLADSVGALTALQEEGKVREIGVSNFGPLDLEELVHTGRVESNQLLYSMLARMIEHEVVPRCIEHQLSILCYSPLAQGLLSGKWKTADEVPESRARNRLFSCERPETVHDEPGCEEQMFATLARIREIGSELGQSMATVALAWCLHKPGVTTVLAGARSPEQVALNAKAAQLELDSDTVRQLDEASQPVKDWLGTNLDILLTEKQARLR
jgi:aryl-alcohol dehydrogenase-like predicted oxidoreductase